GLGAKKPKFFRRDFCARGGIQRNQRGGPRGGGGLWFIYKNARAREGDLIYFLGCAAAKSAWSFPVREGRLTWSCSRDFLFVPIGDCSSFRNFSPARGHASGVE